MLEWLEANAFIAAQALIVVAALLLAAAVVFLVLWLTARRSRNAERAQRITVQRAAIESDLQLREQSGRLRIVRELGEVAINSVSVIIGQADGARYAATADPSAAIRSTAVIADTAKKALADLRRVVTLAREGEANTLPQPRQRTARDLFAVMRDAGLSIVFEESGSPFDLHQGAELAIYRILQESLSNTLKYGGEGTEVTVSFTWRDESLQVLVDDDGIRAQARREGLDPNEVAKGRSYSMEEDLEALTEIVAGPGITEMRERAGLYGGILNTYKVPGVGFSVSAVFPALKYDNGVHGVNLSDHGEK